MAQTRGGPLALLALVLGIIPALAQEPGRLETADRAYATWELLRGGSPLQEELFRLGWPTNRAWQRLTLELAGDPGARLVQASLGSGAGLRLTASDYERGRFERRKRAGENINGPAALLHGELQAFRSVSGAPGRLSLPGGFDPTFLPAWRADPQLTRPWNDDDLGSWVWRDTQGGRYSLDALGFTLLAEVEYARQQLSFEREEDLAGRKTKYLGRTGRDGFFALLALQSAVAKAHELRSLLFDLKSRAITSTEEPLKLDELRFFFAPAWESSVGTDGRTVHKILDGIDYERSHLRGQASVLLGLSHLAALCDPGAPGPLADLWRERSVDGNKVLMFEKDTYLKVVELAVFLFRSMRTLHVDVREGRAVSISGGRTISSADLGLYLAAIEAFMDEIKPPSGTSAADKNPLFKELADEQRKGRTLLTTLAEQIRSWDDPKDPGVYDVYDVKSNQRATRTRTLASQALCVRGLMGAHRALARGSKKSVYAATAEKLVRFMEQDRWVPGGMVYLEPKTGGAPRSTSLLGAVAVLGALREMALQSGDGRALLRYQQVLEGLQQRGLFRPAAERTPPSLAVELSGES